MFPLPFLFGLLGNLVSFMVFLAPVPTFRKIYQKKSAEGFQPINYVVGMFSAMLWIYYAFLKPGTTLLVTINSVGCFIQTIYICFYLFYAPRNARGVTMATEMVTHHNDAEDLPGTEIQTGKMLFLLLVVGLGLIVVLTQFLAKGENRAVIVGWICLVFALCVFVAPLAIMRRVIRTKSVEYMSFPLSFFLTLSAVVWFFYGLLIKDHNIAIPNVLGFIFGVVQMVLYLIYKKKKTGNILEEKLPQVQVQAAAPKIIGLESSVPQNKMPVLEEQIIDVVMLSSMVLSEIVPIVKMDEEKGCENIIMPKEISG